MRHTLKEMAKLVKQYKVDPRMRELAQQLTQGLPSYDRVGEISACHIFARDSIRYVNDVEGVETLQIPPYTCELGSGDCDDKSILVNTLLACIGYQTIFYAVGLNGGFYQHVTGGVRLGTRTIPLETIVPGAPMGWLPPDANPILPWNV